MYMGRVISSPESEILHELRGARVLITGLSVDHGVDVARAFADIKARLIVQTDELSPDMTELFALLTQGGGEIRLYTSSIGNGEAATAFAKKASTVYGGLDAVINLARLSEADMAEAVNGGDAEAIVARRLTSLAHLTRVAANRMRLVFNAGLILNVLKTPTLMTPREAAVAAIARCGLAAMTAIEADDWAEHGIRINSIGPGAMMPDADNGLQNEPDIASLAIYLASTRGDAMSGMVFDTA